MRPTRPNPDPDFEWTVSDQPFDESLEVQGDGPPPAAAAPAQPVQRFSLHLSRRTGLLVTGAALGALLLAWLGSVWGDYQLRQALTVIVADEEAASHGRSISPPQPLTLLFADQAPGVVHAVQRLGPALARVDVARSFTDQLSGDVYRFALPQFYQREGESWKRVGPPAGFGGEAQASVQDGVHWLYDAADAAFIREWDTRLEAILAEACDQWGCPADLTVVFNFRSDAEADTLSLWPPSPIDSRLLSLPQTIVRVSDLPIRLPPLHATGYPLDEASRRFFADTLALLLIQQLAQPAYSGADPQNPFRLALAARLAARLGLDSPRLPELLNPNPARSADDLWRNGYFSGSFDSGETLRSALIIVNRLLADQPRAAEPRLLVALAGATSARDWIARGLELSYDEAARRLASASHEPWPINSMMREPKALVLQCTDGPQVWSPGDERPAPLIDAYLPGSHSYRWSPDGRRLLAHLAGQYAVLDPRAETMAWLPGAYSATLADWASNSVVAFMTWNYEPGESPSYELFDFERRQPLAAFAGPVHTYVPSPDGARAALVRGSSVFGTIYVIPTPADPAQIDFDRIAGRPDLLTAQPIGTGTRPAWSPDGRFLLYTQSHGLGATFQIADTVTGATSVLFNTQALGEDFERRVGSNSVVYASGAWSPSGERALLHVDVYGGMAVGRTWLGLIKADGSDLRWLLTDQPLDHEGPAFSADGLFLAWVQDARLVTYSVAANSAQRLQVANVQSFAWAPSGHQLLVADETGMRLLADGRQANSAALRLTGPECGGGVWNPSLP